MGIVYADVSMSGESCADVRFYTDDDRRQCVYGLDVEIFALPELVKYNIIKIQI